MRKGRKYPTAEIKRSEAGVVDEDEEDIEMILGFLGVLDLGLMVGMNVVVRDLRGWKRRGGEREVLRWWWWVAVVTAGGGRRERRRSGIEAILGERDLRRR